jgi:hypothetical protein
VIQDQINDRCVSLSVRATKLTGQLLAKAMRAFLKKANESNEICGKQSLKSLASSGAALESVEVSGEDIGSFKKVARKYNIDFALKKDTSTNPPTWTVFFKAKDSKSLESAFKEYSKGVLSKGKSDKKPMLEKMAELKEKVTTATPPVKDRSRGEVSL